MNRRNFLGYSTASAGALAISLAIQSCTKTPVTVPGAPSSVLGGVYVSLVGIQGVLQAIPNQPISLTSKYKTQIDQADQSYNAAVSLFQALVQLPSVATNQQTQITNLVATATSDFLLLIAAFTSDVSETGSVAAKDTVNDLKKHAISMRPYTRMGFHSNAATANVSWTTILTYLEIAAGVAKAIPIAAPYAALAQVILQLVQAAVTAAQGAQSQFDLTKLTPVAIF